MENTPRVVALAVGFCAVMAIRAAMAGAPGRFDRDELVALAIFGVGFGVLSVILDPNLRALFRARVSVAVRPEETAVSRSQENPA